MSTPASQVISFRLGGEALEFLEAQRQRDESLSQTAQRLIKALATPSTSSTPLSTIASTTFTPERVESLEKLCLELLQRVDRIETETLGKFAA